MAVEKLVECVLNQREKMLAQKGLDPAKKPLCQDEVLIVTVYRTNGGNPPIEAVSGFLLGQELLGLSQEGGFINGDLVLHPTVPIVLDHECCELERVITPVSKIKGIRFVA